MPPELETVMSPISSSPFHLPIEICSPISAVDDTLHTFLQRFCLQNNTFPFTPWNADPSAVPLTGISLPVGIEGAWGWGGRGGGSGIHLSTTPPARIPMIVWLCVSLRSLMWRVHAGEFFFHSIEIAATR